MGEECRLGSRKAYLLLLHITYTMTTTTTTKTIEGDVVGRVTGLTLVGSTGG